MTSLDDMRRELREKFEHLKREKSNPRSRIDLEDLHFKSEEEMWSKGYVA